MCLPPRLNEAVFSYDCWRLYPGNNCEFQQDGDNSHTHVGPSRRGLNSFHQEEWPPQSDCNPKVYAIFNSLTDKVFCLEETSSFRYRTF